ncbi:class I SAM-dependent methyltransferase [Luedemannella flava]|uniref:class I SAM-dependent methyltransferase n=1 Tax=Luedemannella flava TaxID=349316 RepID=UPI0031CFBCF1
MPGDSDLQLWDRAADRYADQSGGPDDSFFRRMRPFLCETLGPVAGRRILDLGCGHGWLAEELRLDGARVLGVDGSVELLRHARASYPAVGFVAHDLCAGLPRPLSTFDAIVAHMVLMDVPELDALVADVRASLVDDGVFVFSILHPCFFAQAPLEADGERYRKVTGYLAHETRWITSFGGHHHYHRPLSWYVNLLGRHGLAVTALHEPPTLPAHVRPEPEWTAYERWFATIPTMLAVACRPMANDGPSRGPRFRT